MTDSITVAKIKNTISDESFLYLKVLASRVGIDLNDYRKDAIYNRVMRRIRMLKLDNIDEYCQHLRFDLEEESNFINLITNNTTSFFRENHHFEFLKQLLSELIKTKNKIRIWSAGCASGEEPFSIAMVIRETIPDLQNFDIKILATDINSEALYTAENGIYELTKLAKLTPLRQKIWFHRLLGNNSNLAQVNDNIRELVVFKQMNLIDVWPFHGPFDIIFCRNVIIYFNKDVCNRLLEKFSNILDVNGHLILGHSEGLYNVKDRYEMIGKTIYKKLT